MEPDVPYVESNWTGGVSMGDTSGDSWGWLKSIATKGLNSAIDKEFNQPFRTDASGQYAMDPYGRLYLRGTPTGGLVTPVGTNAMPWLIGAGVLVAVVAAIVLLNK